MRQTVFVAALVAFILPMSASAATQADLQALLEQLNYLKQQVISLGSKVSQSVAAPKTTATTESSSPNTFAVAGSAQSPRLCAPPKQPLALGDESDDVANLQIFLARTPSLYPEGKVTGYYGPATQRAVQRLQEKYGLLRVGPTETTGWGSIGPKTIALLQSLWMCDGTVNNGWLTATPSYGPAPLSVIFTAQASSSRPLGAGFVVDFGDGSLGNMTISNSVCNSIMGPCSSVVAVGHRYTKPGNYTAKMTMIRSKNSCDPHPEICPGSPTGFCSTQLPPCTSEKIMTNTGAVSIAVGMPPGQTQAQSTVQVNSPANLNTTTAFVTPAPAAPTTLKLTDPLKGTVVQLGTPVTITWASANAPLNSTVTLSLFRYSSSSTVGTIISGKPTSGTVTWTIPRGFTGGCTTNTIECLTASVSCTGDLCDLAPAVYRIRAELLVNGVSSVVAYSAAFSIGAAQNEFSSIPSSNTSALDGFLAAQSTNQTNTQTTGTNTNSVTVSTNIQTTGTNVQGGMCMYSGVTYADGITLTTTCEDAYKYSCANVAGKILRCMGGQWFDTATNQVIVLPGITTPQSNVQGGCTAPWNNTPVGPNQLVPYEPYFSNGISTNMYPMPLMKCYNPGAESRSAGKWQKCDPSGQTCQDWII